jgi:hypothetical protein
MHGTARLQQTAQWAEGRAADKERRGSTAVAARCWCEVGRLDYGAAGRRNRQTRECLEKVK